MERSGSEIVITAPPYRKEQIKQIPGARFDAKRQVWRLPLSWAVCIIARGVFGDQLEVGPELIAWATEETARIQRVMEAREAAMMT